MFSKEPNQQLIASAKSGSISDIDKALGDGANIDYVDGDGRTALLWAALLRNDDAVRHLIAKGAAPAVRDPLDRDAVNYEQNNPPLGYQIESLPAYQEATQVYSEQAKAYCKALQKHLGGKISRQRRSGCHQELTLKTRYRDMSLEFHVAAHRFSAWVQNNNSRKGVLFSINREDCDNDEPVNHNLIRLEDQRFRDMPVYTYGFSRDATRDYLKNPAIAAVIGRLRLGRFEWFVCTPGQLRLGMLAAPLPHVIAQLDVIADLFALISKPAPTKVMAAIPLKRSSGAEEARHHFGGRASSALTCPNCDEPLVRLAEFDCSDPVLAPYSWPLASLEVACCSACLLTSSSGASFINYASEPPEPQRRDEPTGVGLPYPVPEHALLLGPSTSKAKSGADKLGGLPDWLQSESTPECPGCGKLMPFLAQFASTNRLMFGADMGTVYAFVCSPCRIVSVAVQSG